MQTRRDSEGMKGLSGEPGKVNTTRRKERRNELFENYVSLDELVERLRGKASKHYLYKAVQKGLPHKKILRKLYFDPVEVAQWLERKS